MKSDARASLDDLAIRWETPKGREIKAEVLQDIRHNKGERLEEILKDFIYVAEVQGGRDLRCITLEEMDLSDCCFKGCDLSWASFARSTLERADFRNAILKRACLTEANVKLARFAEADCSRTDFSKSNLEHSNFKDAKMNGAVFVETSLLRASFDNANLAKANFVKANLEQCNFSNADCNNANFSGGSLETCASRPGKAWGIRWDMPLDEFEKQVGLNSLTSRTTKKFKGLDVLMKASQALAKIKGPQAAAKPPDEEMQMGAPTGTKRLETFKRPQSNEDAMLFGATLKKKSDDAPREGSAADYQDEAAGSFDPADPTGEIAAREARQMHEPVADGARTGFDEDISNQPDPYEYVEEGAQQETSFAPPDSTPQVPPALEPRRPMRLGTPPGGTPLAPPGAPRVGDAAAGRSTVRMEGGRPVGGPPPGMPVRPVTGQFKTPAAAAPAPTNTGRYPLPPAAGAAQGPPRAPTQKVALPAGGATAPTGQTGQFPIRPPTARQPGTTPPAQPRPTSALGVPRPAPAPPPPPPAPEPSWIAPLDAAAAEPVTDWAKAIGQLMQAKPSITKIVIEVGDKSRIVYKKP